MPAPQIAVSGAAVECEGASTCATSQSVTLTPQPDVPNGQSPVTPVSALTTEADLMLTEHEEQTSHTHFADTGSSSEDISSIYSPNNQAMDTAACTCTRMLCNCSISEGHEFTPYRQTTDGCTIQRQHEQQQTMAASPPESEASTPPREFSGASSPTLGSSFVLPLTNVSTWGTQTYPYGQAMLTPPSMADHDEVFHLEQQSNNDDDFPSIVPLPYYEDVDMEQSPSQEGTIVDGVAVSQNGFPDSNVSFADYPSSESAGTHSGSSVADDDSVMSDLRDIEPDFDGFIDDDYSSIFGSDGSETVVNEAIQVPDPQTVQAIPQVTEYADGSDDDDTVDFGEAGSHTQWNQWSMSHLFDTSDIVVSPPISSSPESTAIDDSLVLYEAPPELATAPATLSSVGDAIDQSPTATTEQHELTPSYNETELIPENAFFMEIPAHIEEFGNANLPFGYQPDFESNMDYPTFMRQWCIRTLMLKGAAEGPGQAALRVCDWKRDSEITAKQVSGDDFDIQGINWKALGVSRAEARKARKEYYKNYTNLKNGRLPLEPIPSTESFVNFRRTANDNIAHLAHFQLRNLLYATSKNDVYYAGKSMVIRADPFTKTTTTIMDLSRPSESFVPGGVKISTLTATHGVLIAGGFNGEYALASLQAERGTKHVEGCVTSHENGITNHVHTYRSRTSDHPYAVFSSNDQKIRILDCYSNRFLKTHSFDVPVNCSATSPDSRLRVVVSDHTQVLIVDAESGEMVERLDGHSDFGFACAWADDGRHVATGNQDMQVRIYDARNWSQPLKLIPTEMAGCRSLRFSPVGGGKRVLVIAEPADIVSVVDADLFETKQNIDFFGEIGGVSFTPDGRDLFIANMDPKVGGVMEFERSGYGGQYGMRKHRRQEIEDMGDLYVPEEGWDWLEDEDLIWDPRVKWSRNHLRRRGLPLGEVLF
ncbi:MAG: hypothetical protein M1840_007906 [Geoglossum simile]|nr:MAG: hypothetical protein M1840_007906 [Geoglossum simile]